MNKSRQDIKQDLLAECQAKGFGPGSLFVSKSDFWITKIPDDDHSIELHELSKRQGKSEFVIPGEILMLVDVYVVDNYGCWEFWFKFLSDEQMFYVLAYDIIGRLEKNFTVKTNED